MASSPLTAREQAREQALGETLIELAKLDYAGLERCRRAQRETGRGLIDILTGLGLASERDIAEAFSASLSLPLARLADFPLTPLLADDLPAEFLKARRVIPLSQDGDRVAIAMANPFDDLAAQSVAVKLGCRVERHVGVPTEIEEAFEALHTSGRTRIEEIVERLNADGEGGDDDAQRLRDLASEAPVIRLVALLINDSVERRASDIHIEPFENKLRVRYRIDGVMREVASHPSRLRFAIISRIKIMAKMNIAERRLPQDGRIRVAVRGTEVDLRVSTVPTDHGESVVLRVLDKSSVVLDFDRLGFEPDSRDALRALLRRPNGIVLVTGPTGSGKTTSLYTALSELNAPSRKILTVEDPVEYRLEGINQIAIKPQIGLGFADVLRSILRQDPDVIMVGEIRDLETAQIAIQAALTGHLVLSTLHTNSAAATVARLLEMGAESYLLNATLAGVVGQRLVRRLCPACSRVHPQSPQMIAELDIADLAAGGGALREAVGCQVCAGTGYAGRISVVELLAVDEAIKPLILDHAAAGDIQAAAVAGGMRTMYRDGMLKALRGDTTAEEVIRVTRDGG
jgi:general secretion pathway protein E